MPRGSKSLSSGNRITEDHPPPPRPENDTSRRGNSCHQGPLLLAHDPQSKKYCLNSWREKWSQSVWDLKSVMGDLGGWGVYHSVLHFCSLKLLFICSFKACNYSLPDAGLQFICSGGFFWPDHVLNPQAIINWHQCSWPVSVLGTECSHLLALCLWLTPKLWLLNTMWGESIGFLPSSPSGEIRTWLRVKTRDYWPVGRTCTGHVPLWRRGLADFWNSCTVSLRLSDCSLHPLSHPPVPTSASC